MRFLDAGESHGRALCAIIEGMPSGVIVKKEIIDGELSRRQMGYGRGGRMKIERDAVNILSGVRNFTTLGSPIALTITNRDFESWNGIMGEGECDLTKRVVSEVRPGHADLPGCVKYGFDDARNILERASARETAIRVAVGSVAKQFLAQLGITVSSHVINIGGVKAAKATYCANELKMKSDMNDVRCMDTSQYKAMLARIDEAKDRRDTLGGEVEVVVTGMPVGIGSHVHYDRKLDYLLMGAVGSVQSVKSVSIGMGADYADKLGSEVHDRMYVENGKIVRKTNNAGGVEGGISNGEDVVIRATLKPIPTVMAGLDTVDIRSGEAVKSSPERSDVCAVPAGGVVIENAVAFTLAAAIMDTVGGDTMDEVIARVNKMRETNGI